jgi:hypothetical protein
MRPLHYLAVIVLGLTVLGCNSGDTKPEKASNEQPGSTAKAPDKGGPVDSEPYIVSPAAGGSSPVIGSDSIGGGGSGVGDAVKSRAKDVAGKAGGSSLDQLGGD